MATLEIRLLGGFELAREGKTLDPLPLRAARSLFAYLVLNRERPHTRDLLAGLFWPDFDEPRARRRLSQALWQIQTTLAEEERYILGTPDTLRFNPEADFYLDVDRFEALLESEETAEAVALYRGDLLAGFYDDWLLPDQERIRTRFLGALERLSDAAMSKGDHETALLHARRLASEDEFDEEAHRRVMRLCVLLGRHNEAIRQFEECRRILSEELGTEPSAETIGLYEETLADRDAGGRAAPSHEGSPLFEEFDRTPFVGREAERSDMARRLDEVLDGAGGVLLIEGDSGVGKTRLLHEVAGAAGWRGMDVLWGRSASTGGRAFAPIAEALEGLTPLRSRQLAPKIDPRLRSALTPLAPALGEGDEPAPTLRRSDQQARMREAIAAAFAGLGSLTPTLVVIEDAHWADDDTIQALAHLAEHSAGTRVLFAVSYRHGEARERGEVWDLLRSLDRLEHCDRVSLAAFSPAVTEELIRKSLGLPDVSRDFSERLHRDTGGIPLFIVETLRALYEQDDLGAAEVEAEEAPAARDRLPLTPKVHALIRHRLETLEQPSRRTLELVSAHDGDLSLAEIVSASDLDGDAALSAIDDLVRRRMLAGGEGSFGPGHDLMRRAVYDDLPLSRRLDLHRRVALSIEEHRPAEAELLAHHFTAARMPERAVGYLEEAAQRAMAVHAYDTAATYLERASATLDEVAAPAERRFAVATLLDEVLDVLGRREEQKHAVERMERYADDAQKSLALTRKAWWLAHSDRFTEAVATAEDALAMARKDDDDDKVVAALTALGMIACYGGKAAEGVVQLEQAAEFVGVEPRREADARNALGQNLIDLQRFGEAESNLLAAQRIYSEIGDARGEAEVLGMLATMRMERGEPAAAEADYLKAIEISEKIGYRHGEATNQMNLAILYGIVNRLGECLELFDKAAETYGLMGNRRGKAMVQSNAAWVWHSLIGDDQRADLLVRDAFDIYDSIQDARGLAQCHAILGSTIGRAGDSELAISHFEGATESARSAGDAWLTAQALREYATFELQARRTASGLRHARQAEDLCQEFGLKDLSVGVRSLMARLLVQAGEVDRAYDYADRAQREIRPGIEHAHLIPFAMGEVLEALGEEASAARFFLKSHAVLAETLEGVPDGLRQLSMSRVPAHRIVLEKWREQQPQMIELSIPRASAPTGRPLRSEERTTVHLSVHVPSDDAIDDPIQRRRARIQRLLQEAAAQGGAPTVDHLAVALEASSATIRRDLAALRKDGHDVPTRGSR